MMDLFVTVLIAWFIVSHAVLWAGLILLVIASRRSQK